MEIRKSIYRALAAVFVACVLIGILVLALSAQQLPRMPLVSRLVGGAILGSIAGLFACAVVWSIYTTIYPQPVEREWIPEDNHPSQYDASRQCFNCFITENCKTYPVWCFIMERWQKGSQGAGYYAQRTIYRDCKLRPIRLCDACARSLVSEGPWIMLFFLSIGLLAVIYCVVHSPTNPVGWVLLLLTLGGGARLIYRGLHPVVNEKTVLKAIDSTWLGHRYGHVYELEIEGGKPPIKTSDGWGVSVHGCAGSEKHAREHMDTMRKK